MKPTVKKISVEGAAAPAGHYTPVVTCNGLLFTSGQLPVSSDGSHNFEKPFEVQARVAMNNVLALVKAAGSLPADLIKVTVYIVGVEHWQAFNKIYIELLGDVKPARAVVPVPQLHHGYLIEIEAVAAVQVD